MLGGNRLGAYFHDDTTVCVNLPVQGSPTTVVPVRDIDAGKCRGEVRLLRGTL
jgi:hypothetical protein